MEVINKFNVRDIALIAILSTILFVQEQVLTFLPNIQLTVFLLVLYSKKLGFIRTTIIVIIHVLLDNLFMGSMNLVYTPAMFVGWMLIPIIICTLFKKTESPFLLAIFGFIEGFLYSWMFILPNYLLYNINPLAYLASDVLFEFLLAISSFLSILFLYKYVSNYFDKLYINYKH